MRLPPESKTPLWRSSFWGGRGCWVNSSRASFMWFSLLLGGQEPSDRRDGRFSATPGGAEGGTHRLGANSNDYAEAKQSEGHAPECVEGRFCEASPRGARGVACAPCA